MNTFPPRVSLSLSSLKTLHWLLLSYSHLALLLVFSLKNSVCLQRYTHYTCISLFLSLHAKQICIILRWVERIDCCRDLVSLRTESPPAPSLSYSCLSNVYLILLLESYGVEVKKRTHVGFLNLEDGVFVEECQESEMMQSLMDVDDYRTEKGREGILHLLPNDPSGMELWISIEVCLEI